LRLFQPLWYLPS